MTRQSKIPMSYRADKLLWYLQRGIRIAAQFRETPLADSALQQIARSARFTHGQIENEKRKKEISLHLQILN